MQTLNKIDLAVIALLLVVALGYAYAVSDVSRTSWSLSLPFLIITGAAAVLSTFVRFEE